MQVPRLALVMAAGLLTWTLADGLWAEVPRGKHTGQKASVARVKGMKSALADIESGKLRWRGTSTPVTPWHELYVRLLEDECGVEWQALDPRALTSPSQLAEQRGYNAVMLIELEHRFGPGVLERLNKQAEQEYRKECQES